MRRLKAFIIAAISLFNKVEFKRKKNVTLGFSINKHSWLVKLLKHIFDVRRKKDGTVFLNLKSK